MKILGIGLGRTGTRSLCLALQILGIKTKHCPKFYLDSDGHLTIEEGLLDVYDAATDEPCIPIFRTSDRQYPGMKFILTVREKESWLRSVRNNSSAMQEWWAKDPAIPVLHRELYGVEQFDPEIYSDAYDRHIENTKEYFESREKDLLTINICAGDGWEKLCAFLEKDPPSEDFPKTNVFGISDFSTVVKKRSIQSDFGEN